MTEKIVEYCQGNPGALNFLMELYLNPKTNMGITVLVDNKLAECPSIRGTNLYVLYSDLCDKDMANVFELCRTCPNDVLEDACSRQDYSGKELISKYLTVKDAK